MTSEVSTSRLAKILLHFKNWEFALFAFTGSIMMIIFWLGNPKFFDLQMLYWHHIPELFAMFFLGCWFSRSKQTFELTLLAYLYCGITTPLVVIPPERIYLYGFISVFCLALAAPLLMGYLIHQKVYMEASQVRGKKPRVETSKHLVVKFTTSDRRSGRVETLEAARRLLSKVTLSAPNSKED